jgi:hypothetical protein
MENTPKLYFATTLISVNGLPVDNHTGEIVGYKKTVSIYDTHYDYAVPSTDPFTTRNAKVSGFLLDPIDCPPRTTTDRNYIEPDIQEAIPVRAGAKRGPKPKVFANSLARHVRLTHAEKQSWLDDYIYGACNVVGGVSNGKLNVSPSDVVRACMLDIISTDRIQAAIQNHEFQPVSERQARRIAQVARFALDGIALCLERHPQIKGALDYEIELAASYAPPQLLEQAA